MTRAAGTSWWQTSILLLPAVVRSIAKVPPIPRKCRELPQEELEDDSAASHFEGEMVGLTGLALRHMLLALLATICSAFEALDVSDFSFNWEVAF